MTPVTVLSVAYPLAPVGPDAVGGAEQILSQIDAALTKAGHHSLVVACDGSKVAGTLLPIRRFEPPLTDEVRREAQNDTRAAIARALREYPVDVVHMHGLDFYDNLPQTDLPVIATLHLPPDWYPPEIFHRDDIFLHCVSAAQRRACPPAAKVLPEIPNGVPVPEPRRVPKGDYAVSLGRVCPEKGYHLAAEACGRAGVGYLIAGAVFGYEAHQRYFEGELKPRLDGVSRKFIGPVAGEQKTNLLAGAKCLLVPSLVAETSSLVTMEALAAGTPVIAFPSGALTELIEDGRTGFLVNDASDMAEAIAEVDAISPEHCREYALDHFSAERMTRDYIDLYTRVIYARVRGRRRTAPKRAHVADVRSVMPEWRAAFENSRSATPFQSPDWLEPWSQCFGSGEQVVLAVEGGGFLPLYANAGTLRFLGIGTTDYLDIVARDGLELPAAQACVDCLAELDNWTECHLDELRPTSAILATRMPADFNVTVQDSSVCPVLELCGWSVPAKLAKNLRYYRRRLERDGELVFETLPASRAAEFIDTLIVLHEKRWTEKSGGGVLSDPAVQAFHRLALPRVACAGLARLHILRRNGDTIAALYCLAKGGRAYYYLSGFDPAYEAFSPGSLLIEYAIQYAIDQGDREFDFLRGAEAYKCSWGAVNRTNRRLLIRSTRTAA